MLDAESTKLLQELTAEFGRKPSAKRSPAVVAPKMWRSPSGKMHEVVPKGGNVQPVAADPQDGANEIAHSEAFLAVWQVEARETWVMSQQCQCCQHTTVYIAGEYIRFKRKPHYAFDIQRSTHLIPDRGNAHIWRRTELFPDLWLMEHDTAHVVVEREQTTAQCAECLRTGKRVDQLWDTAQRLMLREADAELQIPGIDL